MTRTRIDGHPVAHMTQPAALLPLAASAVRLVTRWATSGPLRVDLQAVSPLCVTRLAAVDLLAGTSGRALTIGGRALTLGGLPLTLEP